MKVYIEQVIITNLLIDFCILLILSKILFNKPNYKRIALSALFGSVSCLILPFCTTTLLANLLKILSSIVMLQILNVGKKQLAPAVILMFVTSYIFGGAILANFGTSAQNGYAIKLKNLLPVFIVVFTFTIITCKLIYFVKSKIITNSNIYPITLINGNTKVDIDSFIDSGNGLKDDNQPVSLINFDTFNKLTNITLDQYLLNQFNTLTNPHFITANTIAGKRKILVFTINELHIKSTHDKIYKNIKLGVALHFDNNKKYKAILNSYFCLN